MSDSREFQRHLVGRMIAREARSLAAVEGIDERAALGVITSLVATEALGGVFPELDARPGELVEWGVASSPEVVAE